MKYRIVFSLAVFSILYACQKKSKLAAIAPDVVTEETQYDTDDPAIWIDRADPANSIVFGTDKATDGGIYAFDLEGKIIDEKSLRGIKRPNNVDVEYDFRLNDSTVVDVLVFTERERQQIRLFSIPDMQPLDNQGFKVFADATIPEHNLPMGIGLYKSAKSGKLYAIVSRKAGPTENYLHQYEFVTDSAGVHTKLVRSFGKFSGLKEIEAVAVDDELGFIYYSDEGSCIRKYYAEPEMGNNELSCFGSEYFLEDIEGIAIAARTDGTGHLIVSDQQLGQFNLFDRITNEYVSSVNISTAETDGCEVVTIGLNEMFSSGLFVAMNNNKTFSFYDLRKLLDIKN